MKRKLHLVCDIETDEFIDKPILTRILEVSIRGAFFTAPIISNLIISEVSDESNQTKKST